MNASMRTTTALTIIRGGTEDNTIPAEAKAFVNFRLLPGDTIADVLWHIKKTSQGRSRKSQAGGGQVQ